MGNFDPLAAEIGPAVWGTPVIISTGFASWQRYCSARYKPNSITLSGSKLVGSRFEPVCDQLRAGSSYLDMWSSNLLEAGRRPVRSQIPLRYPGRRQVRIWFELVADRSATSFEPVCDQLRTSFEPDRVMEFGFKYKKSSPVASASFQSATCPVGELTSPVIKAVKWMYNVSCGCDCDLYGGGAQLTGV